MRLGSVIFFTGIKHGTLHAITYKGLEIEVDSEGGGGCVRQLEAARRIIKPRGK
jgi:hypothetical protein